MSLDAIAKQILRGLSLIIVVLFGGAAPETKNDCGHIDFRINRKNEK